MWQIIRRLYLGDRKDAHDYDLLRWQGITHVLNCALHAAGRSDEALRAFDAALAVDQMLIPVQAVRHNRALVLSDLGRHDEALADVDLAARRGLPEMKLPVAFLRASVALRRGDYDQAGLGFIDADRLALDEHFAENNYALGLWADLLFRALPAGEVFHASAAANRAGAHLRLGQVGPPIEALSAALEKYPTAPALRINRAAHLGAGELDEADADLAVQGRSIIQRAAGPAN